MTAQIRTSDEMFYDLVDLMGREFVSPADSARIRRLGKIIAARQGFTLATVLEAARIEALDI